MKFQSTLSCSQILPPLSFLNVKGQSALRANRQCFGKISDPLFGCKQSIEIDVLAQPDSWCPVTCVFNLFTLLPSFFFLAGATVGGRVCPLPPLRSPRAAARAIQLGDTLPPSFDLWRTWGYTTTTTTCCRMLQVLSLSLCLPFNWWRNWGSQELCRCCCCSRA